MENELPIDVVNAAKVKSGRLLVQMGVKGNRWYMVNILAPGVLSRRARLFLPVPLKADIDGNRLSIRLCDETADKNEEGFPVNLGADNALIAM